MAGEEDVIYTSVVFKVKNKLQPRVKKEEEETVYDEVKVHSEANEKTSIKSIKEEEIVYDELKTDSEKSDNTLDINVLLPDKNEEDRRRWYQQVAWCFGTLFVSVVLGVIAVCIYFLVRPKSVDIEWDQLKSNQTTLLNENYNLTNLNNKLTSDFNNLRKDHDNLTIQFESLVKDFTVTESMVANLTEINQKLESERRNLTEQIQNLEIRQNISHAQWAIDAYCPKENNGRTCKSCQEGWLPSQSSCYAINNAESLQRKTWEDARKDCRAKVSDLVVVSDEIEKGFVTEKSWGSSGTRGYWIGLKAEDKKWKWIDGSELTNHSWIPQPENDNQCVISLEKQGWKSVQCNENQQWICEKEALSV
ncbi:PREDICTED: asialoglycoprotein receptor 1-like [Poecilia mexicana]|uniref:C-type lectin domain-containing protein n=1 Tax=Poecilia mexicana TaxID=48701 RepID=A0A3B3WZ02_9TELE|nr:PREDICTED: asialoglycoprotein receptor 1-like [Poecilia mexicana]